MRANVLASVLLLLGSPASAADLLDVPDVSLAPDEPEDEGLLAEKRAPTGIRVVARGLGEAWHDTAIATHYGGSGLMAGLGLVVPIGDLLAVDAEMAYRRAEGESGSTFQWIPMSLLLEGRMVPAADAGLELFGGLGPVMVAWSESGIDPEVVSGEGVTDGPTVMRGGRPGLEVRLGARIDLGLVQPTMMPGQQDAVKAIELELYGARRMHTNKAGFDFNAWRLGLGLAARF